MPEMFEKVALFFERIKRATFWDRFLPWRWRAIRTLSYEAYSEYKQLLESIGQNAVELEQGRTSIATLRQENEQLRLDNAKSEKELEHLRGELVIEKTTVGGLRQTVSAQDEKIKQWEKDLFANKSEIGRLKDKIEGLSAENSQVREELAGLKESEANLRKEYDNKSATLDRTQNRIEEERRKEKEERHQAEIERIEDLKKNWSRHQQTVKQSIKAICQKNIIEYVEKPPFRGNPDNTIHICEEYVVFDAKAPIKDDIEGFYNYIRTQAEQVKKYAKQDGVRRELFLVIPSNTVNVIQQFSFNMADYDVYVVTVDALEPIILNLKKIEEYEFVNELTPDERDNICRIIGKFAHTAKRRIQIDNFFSLQSLELLTRCESDIPRDMRDRTLELERAEKVNPPQEKRAKELPTKELIREVGNIQREAKGKGMVFSEGIQEGIKALPLDDKDQSGEANHGKPSQ